MRVRITDDNAVEELAIYGDSGIEWTADLIGNTGALQDPEQFRALDDDPDGAEYECDRDTYEWWQEYIDGYNATESDIRDLAEALEMSEGDVRYMIYDRIDHVDMEDERRVVASVIEDIKGEAMLFVGQGPEVMQWQGDDYLYKLFVVPRSEIDEGADGATRYGVTPRYAHDLIGIDSAGLRRVDIRLDKAFGREIESGDKGEIRAAQESAPNEALTILSLYVED